IYSLYNTVYGGFVVSRNPTNGAGYAFTIIYALFSLGAAYGLFVTWLAVSVKTLIIISAYIVKDIAEIIFTIVSRQNYIKDCSTTLKSAGNFTDSDVNDTCVNSFNVALTSNIISTLVDAIIL
ncbi:2009_t:CDS:2, partial [Scutellospora calospora]